MRKWSKGWVVAVAGILGGFGVSDARAQCDGGSCPRPAARVFAPVAVVVMAPPVARPPAVAVAQRPTAATAVVRWRPLRGLARGVFGIFHCGR